MSIETIIENFRKTADSNTLCYIDNICSANFYVEPGYSTEKKSILFSNWNVFPENILKELENEAELEWEDEWTICADCGGAVRKVEDSYTWTPFYIIYDNEILCHNCAKKDSVVVDSLIEENLNNCKKALNIDIDLAKYNFIKVGSYQYQMGESLDAPETVYKQLKQQYENILFHITSKGQFGLEYDVWAKN
jgi:hypothetical protein